MNLLALSRVRGAALARQCARSHCLNRVRGERRWCAAHIPHGDLDVALSAEPYRQHRHMDALTQRSEATC